MKKNTILFLLAVSMITLSTYFLVRDKTRSGGEVADVVDETVSDSTSQVATLTSERKATVFRSSTCGCCMGYIAELEKQGFIVDVKSMREQDMDPIKKQYGIPADKQSCHTTIIGDYFIEGHVPMEAVEKLLTEKPKIDGIGLPDMPFGTPGMPGTKQAPYKIYEKVGDTFSEFVTL